MLPTQQASNVKFVTLNCRSLKRIKDQLHDLCDATDICLLQETWLRHSELPILDTLHEDFAAVGTSALDPAAEVHLGRPYGGVAILWRKSISKSICVIPTDEPRLVAVKIKTADSAILVINVYMPTNSTENLPDFLHILGKIEAVASDNDITSVMIAGDFNATPSSIFANELDKFCREFDYTMADRKMLSDNTYTYVSDAFNTTSWLDHCIISNSLANDIVEMKVDYLCTYSDHLPLYFKLKVPAFMTSTTVKPSTTNSIPWRECKSEQYRSVCESELKNVIIPRELIMCNNCYCVNEDHLRQIDRLYNCVMSALGSAAKLTFKRVNPRVRGRRKIPGWNQNEELISANQDARTAVRDWITHGRPRSGEINQRRIVTRAHFKLCLKQHRKALEQRQVDCLVTQYQSKDFASFWKHTGTKASAVKPQHVDMKTDDEDIAEHFKQSYLGDSAPVTSHTSTDVTEGISLHDCLITFDDIKSAIKELKRGKSGGPDGLRGEHFIHASEHLSILLAICFTFMLIHRHLPLHLCTTDVVPVPKSKCGSVTKCENYRPIAIASVSSKILERVIVLKCETTLNCADNQFGFKEAHGTDMAIFTLKSTISHYINQETPVYVGLLDFSKAFDRVNRRKLLEILKSKNVPARVVDILRDWYSKDIRRVRWGAVKSSPFQQHVGVRQGSIMSPLLFNAYMDDLSKQLNQERIGCMVGGTRINHISYADDMVILAPSLTGLRKLLGICENYALGHELLYNVNKTEYIVFQPKGKKFTIPGISLNGEPVKRVSSVCYLGHIICDDLSDGADIDRQCRNLCVRANMLNRRFSKCSQHIRNYLFNTYCANFYASALWVNKTLISLRKFTVCYNNAFRIINNLFKFCSASEMFVNNDVCNCSGVLRKNMFSLRERACKLDNRLVKACVRADNVFHVSWFTALRHF